MELLNRYLHAVRFWLPKRQQEDILAELAEDIRSEIEERETALGRALTDAELADLLRPRGDPMRVATGYLPQHYLIGPALFPVYALVLKILAACYFVLWALVWLGYVVGIPGHHATHPVVALLRTWGGFWTSAFFTFGVTTLVFAVMERSGAAARWKDGWDPRKLPAVRDPKRIPRGSSIAGMVFGMVFVVWWAQLPQHPALEGDGVRIALGPGWRFVYGSVLGLTAAGIAVACMNLLRPWWTRMRAGIRLALDAASLVPVVYLLGSGSWVQVTATGSRPVQLEAISRAINLPVRLVILVVGILVLVACVGDVIRIVRLRQARP